MIQSVITGTGAYVPENIKKNKDFLSHTFYNDEQEVIKTDTALIIQKFEDITGITERVYASPHIKASDMAIIAARRAVESSGINPEQIDYIIVAHNYGDRTPDNNIADTVPSLSSRVKNGLGIQSSSCIPYDILFGCPGWLQAVIQADLYIRAGDAHTCLVIGTETLSRVIDNNDRDCMIFSDGAGACIVQREDNMQKRGLLASSACSHALYTLDFIYSGPSSKIKNATSKYLKMQGHKVYNYALSKVPEAMKQCFDKTGIPIHDLKMIFLHQANEKMDSAIVREFYKLYDIHHVPDYVMPMNISWMGNNSVATIPILLNQVINRELPHFSLQHNDIIMFASVGAGMNINAVTYRW